MGAFFIVCAVLGIIAMILEAVSGGSPGAQDAVSDTNEPDPMQIGLLSPQTIDDGLHVHVQPSIGDSPFNDHPLGGINPANGMPMLPGDAIDIMGNPFGVDLHDSLHTGIGDGLGCGVGSGIGHSGCGFDD